MELAIPSLVLRVASDDEWCLSWLNEADLNEADLNEADVDEADVDEVDSRSADAFAADVGEGVVDSAGSVGESSPESGECFV
ncbi:MULTISPECIES: hypothetical protein [Streptomyces]|uniref:hypothetical protein n=1 Tax=Streptomyces TaxID=1883 RepID=UPI001F3DEE1A|nr:MULTISPECIES: hypothetical protein [unclassified Streptomyces]